MFPKVQSSFSASFKPAGIRRYRSPISTTSSKKIGRLVSRGLCRSYVLMTNARVTGAADANMHDAIAAQGAKHVLILNGTWINRTIATHQRLRMLVPRIYGLGDLSQILDERAYSQAHALLTYLSDELATFVVTEAYRRAVDAIADHGFCLLLGEPAVGEVPDCCNTRNDGHRPVG